MLRAPSAILFDMDGTITRPLLDFALIRREMGIGPAPILETLAQMPSEQRLAAEAILLRHEEEAAAGSALNEGCEALMELLDSCDIQRALITRNSLSSAQVVLGRHALHFDVLITREDGKFKPDPAPLLEACKRLRVNCSDAWMVGDGQYDIDAGQAAGSPTVWVSHGRISPFAARPDLVVKDLTELTDYLRACLPERT